MKFKTLIISFLFINTSIWANFSMEPFVIVLRSNTGQLTEWITLKTNQDNKPVPVELTIYERNLDENGMEEENPKESDQLVVYPSETVLFPGEPVKVQVSWAGKNKPDKDVSFTLQASEIPINLKNTADPTKASGQVSTLIRYKGIVGVETGKQGKLNVKSIKMDSTGTSLMILVENIGAGRVPTENMHLMIRGVKYSTFRGADGNSIMPGSTRKFFLDIPFVPSANEITFGY